MLKRSAAGAPAGACWPNLLAHTAVLPRVAGPTAAGANAVAEATAAAKATDFSMLVVAMKPVSDLPVQALLTMYCHKCNPAFCNQIMTVGTVFT